MKKRLLLLFAVLTVAFTAMAKPVDKATASQVAKTYLQSVTGKSYMALTDITVQTPFHEFYVFALGSDKGFILVAADDCVFPILGYSEDSRFITREMPAHVMEWMQMYDTQIAFYRENYGEREYGGSLEVRNQWESLMNGRYNSPQYTAVSPLLTTTWNQSPYYNNLCPTGIDDYGETAHAVTGCAATAAAQIMKYWNHPTTGYGSYSYYHPDFDTLSANFGATTYQWSNMPNALNSSSSTTQVNAVATLMYHVGVAIEMNYGLSGSGGATSSYGSATRPSVENAFIRYFKYQPTCHTIYRDDFSDDEWCSMLRAELDAQRPILYTGYDPAAGHAYVFDGYDNSGKFHVNWGWGGSCDGYYFVGYLNPVAGGTGSNPTHTFNLNNYALIGVQPNNNWSTSASTTVTLNVSNSSAGSVAGAGTYAFGDTIYFGAYANDGYRFNKWSDGSTVVSRGFIASGGNINLTAELGPLTGDTLDYCFNNHYTDWGYGAYQINSYWGIMLPSTVLANHDPLTAVQLYVSDTATFDLTIYTGSSDPTTVVYTHSYFVDHTGWVDLNLTTPLAVDGTQNLWIFVHNYDLPYPMSLSLGSGNSYGSLYVFNVPPTQECYTLGSNYAWMMKAVFGYHSNGNSGGCPARVATIGDEESTTTSYEVPVNNWYNYTLSETIIDADEIGGPLTISSLSYYYNHTTASTSKNNCVIYLQPTTKTTFSNASDIELLSSDAVMVYSGPLNCTQGWNEFTFTTPFEYDGTSNLMVIVDDNSGNYNGNSYVFRTSSCTGYKSIALYSDNQNPDLSNISSYTGNANYWSYRVLMRLKGCPPCTPAEKEIGDIESTTSQYDVPYNTYYNYSLTESIIDATEIGGAMEISGISYKYAHTTATNPSKCGLKIWIKPTNKVEFSSTTDLELVDASATLVYEGSPSFTQGWNDITFTNPYSYDGNGNLIVIVFDSVTGYDNSSFKFYTAATTDYKTLSWFSDSYCPNPLSSDYSGSKNRRNYRPVMKLQGCDYSGISCPAPRVKSITYNDYNSVSKVATVIWDTAIVTGPEYETRWTQSDGTYTTYNWGHSGGHNFQVLYEDTNYIAVRAICGEGDTSEWSQDYLLYVTYCQPAPTSCDEQGITNVYFGSGNEVVNNSESPTSAPFYGNYKNMIGAVPAGAECSVNITYATGYTYGTIIWVDWNKDLEFDSDEVVYVGESTNTNPTNLNASFMIPATQDTGTYRMRIAGADSYYDNYIDSIAAAAYADPCPTSTWTIVHDYTLRVTASSGTDCGDITTLPYNEGFENGLGCWSSVNNSTDGVDWSVISGVGSSVAPHSGNGMASSWSWNSNAMHADAWLISPKFILPNTTEGLTFSWWDYTNSGYPDSYSVVLSTTTDDITAFTTTVRPYATASDDWTMNTIDLSAYAGQSVYIAFHHVDYDENYLLIDDISLFQGTYIPPAPDTLTVTFAVNNATMGTTNPVPGTYQYLSGETVQFSAVPNQGYQFVGWEWIVGTEIDTLDANYISASFPVNAFIDYGSMTFTALFEAGNPDSTTITYAVNDATMGTTVPAPGTYNIYVGNNIDASAVPNNGYALDAWVFDIYMNGTIYSSDTISYLDDNFDNPINFGILSQAYIDYGASIAITAIFSAVTSTVDSMLVNIAVNDATMGTTVPAPGSHYFYTGDTLSVIAVPNTGYMLEGWTVYVSHATQGVLIDTVTVTTTEPDVFNILLSSTWVVGQGDNVYFFDVTANFAPQPTCTAVTDLTVTATTTNSATITWNGSAANYSIYQDGVYVANVATTPTTMVNSYTFTGLTTATSYTFGVVAVCSATDSSEISTITTSTECDIISTYPYLQDFNATPACWLILDADGDGQNWFLYQGTIQSASYNSGVLTPDNWLISPQFAIPATGNYEVTWTATAQDQSWPQEHYGVYISTTSGTDTNAYTLIQQWTLTTGVFNPVIDLSTYAGQNIYIAFRHFNCTDMFRLSIDDFIVRQQAAANEVVINVNQNNPAYGSVTGGGTYTIGDSVTVSASANSGYQFSRWADVTGATISNANPYTFVAATDLTLTAIFVDQEATTYTLTVEANDSTMGMVAGGGTYTAGEIATLIAYPYSGYHFVNWTQTSSFGINEVGTDPVLTITVTADHHFIANFAADTATVDTMMVTIAVNNASMGTTVPAPGIHYYYTGDTCDIVAVPNTGYLLESWSIIITYDAYNVIAIDTTIAAPSNVFSDLFAEAIVVDDNYGLFSFNVTANFAPIPVCQAVTNLSVDTATANSVTVSWNGTAANYSLYLDGNYVANVPATATTAHNSYTFTGLSAATSYTFGVVAVCSATDSSVITQIMASTECDIISVYPYLQDFNGSVPCWMILDADGDGQNWFLYQGTIQSASYNSGVLTPDNWLISPQFAIPATGNYEVTWTATAQDQSWPQEHYGVYISTTSGTDTNAYTLIQEWTLSTGIFNPVVNLSAYAGQNIYIALRHFNCTDMFRLSIDNFIVRQQAAANEVVINVNQNNPAYGSVTGGGTYTIGDSVTVSATANSGYQFSRWADVTGATISSANPYTFVATADLTLTAIFVDEEATTYTVTVEVNDSTMGYAIGGGAYTAGDLATLVAMPYDGYRFVNWTQSSSFGINEVGTDPVLTITVTGDRTFIANFEEDTAVTPGYLTLVTAVNNPAMGTMTPAPGEHQYAVGETVHFSVTPNDGYRFENANVTVYYMGMLLADTTVAVDLSAIDLEVEEQMAGFNINVTVNFAPIQQQEAVLNVSVNDSQMGQVLINETPVATYTGWIGEPVSLKAVANQGYKFVSWSDGNTDANRVIVLEEPVTNITANFEIEEVGIDDQPTAADSQISIYPNPTTGFVTIDADDVVKVEVMDLNGRVAATFENSNHFDLSNLSAGTYLLRIQTSNGSALRRIVKK